MNTVEEILNQAIENCKSDIRLYEKWIAETEDDNFKKLYTFYINNKQEDIITLESIKAKLAALSVEEFWYIVNTFYSE